MHVQNHERVQNFYPFRKKLKENPDAYAYKLMLCIVFMEVSGGQLTKYISGGKKAFSTGCLMEDLIYFLNSNTGFSTTSF